MKAPAPEPRLSDGIVTLRPPDERDLPAIEAGIQDPDVVRWIGPPEWTATETLALNRARRMEGSPTFAICDPGDRCVGHVWVNRSAEDPSIASVGYWLLPAARGRGLATRAVSLLAKWAIAQLDLRELRLTTDPANARSRAVAERSGFVHAEHSSERALYVFPLGGATRPRS